jgi:c-di-AMP phosphodiesterase-like protein
LLQYLTEPRDILKTEAAALLAGLVLDTKNFTLKTGSRTFEAAAFLRTAGADTVEVQNFFRLDIEQAAQKADIIRLAELFKDVYAVSVMRDAGSRIIAGQSADELLKISGVKASFVVFEQDNGVNISARSTGDVNVQLIMEKLGGGGNAQAAAAQSKDKTREEFRQELLKVLEKEK